jgi:diadenosine tetraphosphatase ApaH/serine/threonine PP2A family protein phosphatase
MLVPLLFLHGLRFWHKHKHDNSEREKNTVGRDNAKEQILLHRPRFVWFALLEQKQRRNTYLELERERISFFVSQNHFHSLFKSQDPKENHSFVSRLFWLRSSFLLDNFFFRQKILFQRFYSKDSFVILENTVQIKKKN